MSPTTLKRALVRSLRRQGFTLQRGVIVPHAVADKQTVRNLHREAVKERVARSAGELRRREPELLSWIANGDEVHPEAIQPRLVQVRPNTEHELLFRYVRLHWSIPVSAGYGRRLRFLVLDRANGKLIGVIGLGDPVCNLADRDRWIGWNLAARRERLRCVMDAFVLGAVPPYSYLLCGKLVAALAASDSIRAAFRHKYGSGRSWITGRRTDARLVLVTTASALGRSSMYNRIRHAGETLFVHAGWTRGSGDFHFSNGMYGRLFEFARGSCSPTAKHAAWGSGFRNRREVVRKCLGQLGLSQGLIYHGIRREIFVVPLARNAREFLRGEARRVRWYHRTVADLFAEFRARWLLPRAARDSRYQEFRPEQYRLWD